MRGRNIKSPGRRFFAPTIRAAKLPWITIKHLTKRTSNDQPQPYNQNAPQIPPSNIQTKNARNAPPMPASLLTSSPPPRPPHPDLMYIRQKTHIQRATHPPGAVATPAPVTALTIRTPKSSHNEAANIARPHAAQFLYSSGVSGQTSTPSRMANAMPPWICVSIWQCSSQAPGLTTW